MDGKGWNGFYDVNLLSDGHFEDLVYNLSYTDFASVCTWYQKHCTNEEMENLINNNKELPSDHLDELIVERFEE